MKKLTIKKIGGTDERLYPLVGPLAMNAEVIKQNGGYPFKTSDKFTWYIALDGKAVVGLLPVEQKAVGIEVANYYLAADDPVLLKRMLAVVTSDFSGLGNFVFVARTAHAKACWDNNFKVEKKWVKYTRMIKKL
ncbi:MAG: hypothetical protein LBK76_02555 [Verrucomicrobiales bacterium]|jgi:hypothetical protein|nr:hypothetical protein [Verrucomicrobiales bacterium]